MTMIKIIDGDLLEATEDIIGHQVNCMSSMGSGVAVDVKEKYPRAFSEYLVMCGYYDEEETVGRRKKDMLGEVQFVLVEDDKFVANIFGQLTYGKMGSGQVFTNEKALKKGLKKLRKFAEENQLSVALPYKIGSVRGGSRWEKVEQYIEEAFEGYEVTLYKYDKG